MNAVRTYVITGGTDGIGKGLGLHFLTRGDRVITAGSTPAKGEALRAEAERLGAADRFRFLRADLSTLNGMRSVVAEVEATTERLDGLVFATQRFRPRREETPDGLEYTFALSYLSRFVIGHGLAGRLDQGHAPVVFNLAGPGGLPGRIHWDDPQLHHGYTGKNAAMQASRCNDLLGVDFPQRHPGTRIRYVLYNPLFVKTSLADPLPQPQRAVTKTMAWLLAQRVDKAIPPMVDHIDHPPAAQVTAFRRRTPIPLTGKDFDPDAADRLHELTLKLLAER
ncbi:SDR family NAD(P)-dependent oxidoreductase [Glycomyces sp. TRM65418]|uniref:SDR family NAD(P)-dependent oxidoreductase n=1 Tax=Glycomyces sp. TRM65418 TaxID=2867006 RepID=UPI001CE5AF63|nr:SDR family NAD(P)-dependent oxidoreductase [Glycomyces sp. TRM65418]MCC3764144.1 SDR family NAD(P)-dependent oxidoreductase [Glycomyces sp. TRM65418]QZD53830.1 SDR family NAD(P)-dependent oxidoreductase [Glycomyces sp. TRM65418]